MSPSVTHNRNGGLNYTLVANVLIQPDAPTDSVLIVNLQLVLQQRNSALVDLWRLLCTIVLLPGIDRAELAVPDREVIRLHPLHLTEVAPLDPSLLLRRATVGLRRRREPVARVVVHGIHRVIPLLARLLNIKVRKVRGKRVSVQEQDVVRVDLADGRIDLMVPGLKSLVGGVAGLVERVVSSDPRIALEVGSDLLPEPDAPVLEVLVGPELGNVMRRVRVPISVLAAGRGVHVEDGVDALVGAEIDDAVEPLEAVGLEHAWVHVVFKVAVVEGDTDAVQSQGLVVFCIFFGEEVFEELYIL